jgi:hypothetical protein
MDDTSDKPVLNHIQRLVEEERLLYGRGQPAEADIDKLRRIEVELDQCWDLLRQRRALREFGRDPDEAEVRPERIVEKYQG